MCSGKEFKTVMKGSTSVEIDEKIRAAQDKLVGIGNGFVNLDFVEAVTYSLHKDQPQFSDDPDVRKAYENSIQ
jgi:hypothetical protein